MALRNAAARNWQRTAKIGVTAVSVVGALYAARSAYKLWQASGAGPQGNLMTMPVPDVVQRENVWTRPTVSPLPIVDTTKTMTEEQIVALATRSLGHAFFFRKEDGQKKGSHCDIFALVTNVYLIPYHIVEYMDQTDRSADWQVEVTYADPSVTGPNFKGRISRTACVRIQGTDLCVINLPAGGSRPNVLGLFPEFQTPRTVVVRELYRKSDGSLETQSYTAHPSVYKKNGLSLSVLQYHRDTPTFNGLCMATMIVRGTSVYIGGFHVAGRDGETFGVANMVTREQIQTALSELYSQDTVFQAAACNHVSLDCPEYSIRVLDDVHFKSPTGFLPDPGTLQVYGQHTGMRRHFKSDIVPTIISPTLEEAGIPRLHGKPAKIGRWEPWYQNLLAMAYPQMLPPSIMDLAFRDLKQHVFRFLEAHPEHKALIHPIDITTALSGADGVYGVDALPLNTSMGWPHNTPKRNVLFEIPSIEGCTRPLAAPEWLLEEVEIARAQLARGERIGSVFRANLKDEPTKLGKDKVRVFAGAPIVLSILVRQYFLMISKYITEHPFVFECAVGANCYGPEWTKLMKFAAFYGITQMVAGDYKDYDKGVASQRTFLAFLLLILIAEWAGFDEADLVIMRGIATEICQPIYEWNGEFVSPDGSNPSGHNLTVVINNIVNSLYLRFVFYMEAQKQKVALPPLEDPDGVRSACGDVYHGRIIEHLVPCVPGFFRDYVAPLCYGDDNVMSVHEHAPWFNHTSIAECLGEFGVIYTMADKTAESRPYIHQSEVSFLKRRAVWSEKFGQYLAPIEEASIWKSLHCMRKSKFLTPEEYAGCALDDAMLEYFYHGKEKFEQSRTLLSTVVESAGIAPFLKESRLRTYEEYEEQYIEKYLGPDFVPFGSKV